MFYFYGRKGSTAHKYPTPLYETIVEPFAGSMAYSCHHAAQRPTQALGFELDPRVADLWNRLLTTGTPPPIPPDQTHTDDLYHMTSAADHGSLTHNVAKISSRMRTNSEQQRRLTERLIPHTKNFHVVNAPYTDAPDIEATWFIDPPYAPTGVGRPNGGGGGYKVSNSGIDYPVLAAWCRSRRGQVIVCEQEGADWLPFTPLPGAMVSPRARRREVIWTN